ncbi:plasmid stabilization protein [Streptomyces sp. NPDC005056]
MPAGSSRKRERQYEHLKESAEKRGASEGRAKEISARAVNKERARSGEAKTASTTSTRDPKSASQRGGERSRGGQTSAGATESFTCRTASARNRRMCARVK